MKREVRGARWVLKLAWWQVLLGLVVLWEIAAVLLVVEELRWSREVAGAEAQAVPSEEWLEFGRSMKAPY